jgi:hypothetical protein
MIYECTNRQCNPNEQVPNNDPLDIQILFIHGNNNGAYHFLSEVVNSNIIFVCCYFGGGNSYTDNENLILKNRFGPKIHFSTVVARGRSPHWFIKDFFEEFEKGILNFDIFEKGNSQVAIDTLHKLREVVLTPFTALHLLLQTDTTSDEIENIFKDTKGNKLDISDHISKSKSTLNALLKTISPNNIPPIDRLPEFSDDQDLLRIKKQIDEKAEELLTLLYNKISGLNVHDFKSIQNSRNELVLEIENFATAFENLIQHVEEKALVQ